MKQGNERKMMNKEICTDIDGNVYKTIKLGKQVWMAENLKVTHYRDGTPIHRETDDSVWDALSTGAYCEYENDLSNVPTYGRLYNWYAVDDVHGLAPEGWHVPTDEEWKELEMYLGMSETEVDSIGSRGTNEGCKLAGNADLWYDSLLVSDPAFGTSGFTALPGGYRNYYGYYDNMTYLAKFWSSSESSSAYAWYRYLYYYYTDVFRYYSSKRYGFSVRCVRD